MGDLVLTEDQIGPVMDAALDNGLEVTALHNHFAGESPRVMFMHVGGMGPEPQLAAAVGRVFAALRATPARTSPIAPIHLARSRAPRLHPPTPRPPPGRHLQIHRRPNHPDARYRRRRRYGSEHVGSL